jgi:predicted permease
MSSSGQRQRETRLHLRLIAIIGVIVPAQSRADWRQEWETELRHRERLLADWDRLDRRHKLDLIVRSSSAFWDALWLQRRRLKTEVMHDLKYGLRTMLAQPGFTVIAVLTLALGIGANAALFGLLDKALIRTLPVERPDQLVAFVKDAGGTPEVFSYPKYTALRDHEALSGLIAYLQRPFSISIEGGHSDRVVGQVVSGNYFDVLGVEPALGRFFLPEEDRTPGTHPVVVISRRLWLRGFGGDPAAIGRAITVNGFRYTVIGVAPSEFTGTNRGGVNDVYVPTMMQARATDPQRGRSMLANPNANWLRLIGRLRPGVTREQAQAALAIGAEESAGVTQDPRGQPRFANTLMLMDGSRGHTDRVQDLSLPLMLMMGVVGFVLLTACANIANLLLARTSTRQKEMAVRLAIGANRWRIVRQLLTESTILATLGGGVGLLVASWVTGTLLGFEQPTSYVPRALDGGLDFRVLVFTAGLSFATAVLFSLAPSLYASTTDFGAALKRDTPERGGRPWRWSLRNGLVVTQVALSLIVLIGAGLCVKSLRALQAIDPGFEPARVVTASFDLGANVYDETRGRQFITDLSERVRHLPGVETVSLANVVAFSDLMWISGANPEGYQPRPGEMLAFDFNAVSPDYFRTLGMAPSRGRTFTGDDTADALRVAIVNEATVRRYWPGQDAVGKLLQRGPQTLEVVGVIPDTREKGLTVEPRPAIYLPLAQSYTPELTLHVRTAIDPRTLIEAVRREVQAIDPSLPLYNLRTLSEQRDGTLYAQRAVATMLTLFGLLALVVAAVGIYGVLSYGVTERTRELGIRMAHGARPRDLLGLVIAEGMLLTLLGLVIGVGGAFGLTRLIDRLLFGVSPTDPLTFAAIPLLLAGVALVACGIPAWRATRMDPLEALRYE